MKAWPTSILLLVLLCTAAVARPRAATPPNIVLIMADDMGFSDLGCYGGEIETPNLDRLASEGLRFTRFYNAARCCPTRAALLTGLYPHQAGVGHMIEDRGAPAYRGFLNDRCVTLAEALRDAGYRTLMSGKWHVGEQRPHWPVDRGFDRSFALVSSGRSYFRLPPGRKMAIDGQEHTPPDRFYLTDLFTDHALRLLDDEGKGNQPFFLYLPYTAPHWPLHALPEDIAKYRGKYRLGWDALRERRHRRMLDLGIVDRKWPLTPRDPQSPAWSSLSAAEQDAWDLKMAVYAAQVDRMDRNIGRVLARLRELGEEGNTLVMFLADNGGCAEELTGGAPGAAIGTADSYASYGLPWANASNTPFRRYKHWVHEGGISTPLIVRWPAGLQGRGRLTPQVGHLVDVMPTCLAAAGAPYPERRQGRAVLPTEGKSLLPVFRGDSIGDRTLYWEHEGNRAVRQGRWKLVSQHPAGAREAGGWELYDLDADRTELKDLAAAHPGKVTQLKALYDAWAARCGVLPWPLPPAPAPSAPAGRSQEQ